MSYRNPVIPGFHPDPSVCRVGEDYYLVTSSFEYFPGVPIFHSRDLVHWRQIGHCLTRPSQLPLERAPSSTGIYAPTIRHHDGMFYMVTTNVSDGRHLYVSTQDPAGEWSEPVWVDVRDQIGGSIDPSLFFDDDGAVYLTCTVPGWRIFQAQIDLASGKLLTEPCLISRGTGNRWPEGPHLYKIGGLYYLMLAEGGTEYGHLESIARGESPWGPFEPCPHNPILTHRNVESPIQATGHADLIQAHDGSWWLVFLAVRPNGYPPCYHLGRETFLAPVTWTADGWPVVGDGGKVALDMDAPTLPLHPWPAPPARDDFDAPALALQWNFLRNPRAGDRSLAERPGWLRLKGSAVTLDDVDSPAFVGRRQQHFACRAATLIDFAPGRDGEEAGLTVRMNERHHAEIAVTRRLGQRRVVVRQRIGSLAAEIAGVDVEPGPLVLEIRADRDTYRFGCAPVGEDVRLIASAETRYLSTEVAGGFTGVYLGLYATGRGCPALAPADFDWFDYTAFEESEA